MDYIISHVISFFYIYVSNKFIAYLSNIDKMLMRTNEAGRVRSNGFKLLYRLANNVGGGDNTVITLSRVAAVFPAVTLELVES